MNTDLFRIESRISERNTGAEFSRDRKHRFLLWRCWGGLENMVLFVGLNPSVADEQTNDPTIRRCIGFAKREGASGVMVGNLFSYCATHPQDLKRASRPVRAENGHWLQAAQSIANQTIVCWGNHGTHREQSEKLLPLLGRVRCFGKTQTGEPRHPLYLRNNAELSWYTAS
ncbi:MAG TPA: DUF1643 domain-containing protein [Xanthomonadales bacterium]|nr:DUF1643 domain-containing protein [Xanthomonadales bacterium]